MNELSLHSQPAALEQIVPLTVAVPVSRMAEFHLLIARFHAADDTAETSLEHDRLPFEEADQDDVSAWWGMLSEPARRVLELLARHPGERYTGTDLAAKCGIEHGANGLAGTLSWPGKYAKNRFAMQFPVSWNRDSQEYWMTEPVAQRIVETAGADQ